MKQHVMSGSKKPVIGLDPESRMSSGMMSDIFIVSISSPSLLKIATKNFPLS